MSYAHYMSSMNTITTASYDFFYHHYTILVEQISYDLFHLEPVFTEKQLQELILFHRKNAPLELISDKKC